MRRPLIRIAKAPISWGEPGWSREIMQCTNCGVDADPASVFCPSCGKPTVAKVDAEARAPGGLHPNLAGLLCYVLGLLTGIFFLAVHPYRRNSFVRFHAFQSIFLTIAWVVLYFVIQLFASILPRPVRPSFSILSFVMSVGFLPLFFISMYKAYTNEKLKLPAIGRWAEKQT
jgi:uncharacterized membrane protein